MRMVVAGSQINIVLLKIALLVREKSALSI